MGRAKLFLLLTSCQPYCDRVNFSAGSQRIELPGERTNSPTFHRQDPNSLRGYQRYLIGRQFRCNSTALSRLVRGVSTDA